MKIGQRSPLRILNFTEVGAYLEVDEEYEVLLPKREIPEGCNVGDTLDVFLYFDSEDRLIATTAQPKAMVGEIASLKVVAVEPVGAFLDWGLQKDLFLPFAEQTRRPVVSEEIMVCLYVDNSHRISASMRLDKRLPKTPLNYKPGQPVQLVILGKSDLGWKALIEKRHFGVLYENEVFQSLTPGQQIQGFIKAIREDQKIDLSLTRTGHQGGEDIAPIIVEKLKASKGFLAITDKTSPEAIYKMFGVSKKKFKIALGGLYKKRIITISDEGIRLVATSAKP